MPSSSPERESPCPSSGSSPPSEKRTTARSWWPWACPSCSTSYAPQRYRQTPPLVSVLLVTPAPAPTCDVTPPSWSALSFLQNDAIVQQLTAIFSHCFGPAPLPAVPEMKATLSAQLGKKPWVLTRLRTGSVQPSDDNTVTTFIGRSNNPRPPSLSSEHCYQIVSVQIHKEDKLKVITITLCSSPHLLEDKVKMVLFTPSSRSSQVT